KKVRDVRSFLGLASYYRRFVKEFTKIARPLNHLLKNNVKFEWTNDCKQAFENLKTKLIEAPILILYHPELPVTLHTDACGYGIG
ncbi:hypothetical protein B4U79_01541, partial [Dinothrombium tinctorium]